MKRIKAFFYVIKNSLTNLEYYKDLLKVPTAFSIKYFLCISLIAATTMSIHTTVKVTPKVAETLNKFITEMLNLYPDNLEITAKDGKWEINQTEPFAIKTPGTFEQNDAAFPENLIIFYHNGTINDLNDLNTFMLVNDKNVIAKNSRNGTEVYPLDNLPEGTFTKQKLAESSNRLYEYVKLTPFFIFLGATLLSFLYYFGVRSIYLLFVGLMLYVMGLIKSLKLGYGAYYRIALHTFTLPLILEIIFNLIGTPLPIPFWFLTLNVVFGVIVLFHLGENKKSDEPKEPAAVTADQPEK